MDLMAKNNGGLELPDNGNLVQEILLRPCNKSLDSNAMDSLG